MSEEDSKFGFKDAEKAKETLKLLESEELQYQKLTVRGLVGRAKRVLTMTKNKEKVANITAAIELFEEWLEKNASDPSANKNAKPADDSKVDTVQGLGFKDVDSARKTLEILEGRDPDYQKLAIKGLIGSSKRVLSGTKNEEKIKSIKSAVKILEDFLEKFDAENRSSQNKAYLPSEVLEKLPKSSDKLIQEFVEVYTVKTNYKMLRTIQPTTNSDETQSWDIIRNRELSKIKSDGGTLFTETGEVTASHLKMIYWAYSPQPAKVKAFYGVDGKSAQKRESTGGGGDSSSSPAKKRR